jgi:two-component system, NarL family, response regulator NreC
MNDSIRVLIADDHTIVRSGVRLLLEAEPDLEVVGEAVDGNQALQLAGELRPDVVLMDIAMPVMDGLEATRRLKHMFPQIQVLILTMHRSDEYFFEILRAGASGYLLKGADTSDLIKAVRVVSQGEAFLYPSMAQKLIKDFLSREPGTTEAERKLTPREHEILCLKAEGYSNKEVAQRLVISPSTVNTHLTNLMDKLQLTNHREIIQYARQHGLLKDL